MLYSNITCTHLLDNLAHLVLPVVLPRLLWDEDEVCASRDTSHKGQPTTMPAHDLDDERPGVGGSGRLNVIDHLADPSESGVSSDGSVCAREIVVDGAHEAYDVEVLVRGNLLHVELLLRDELFEQRRPFSAEPVGTSERAITTADDKGINAVEYHVLGGRQTARALVKGHATSSPDQSAAFREVATHIVPFHLFDEVASTNQAFVALVDTVRIAAHVNCHADDSTDDGVHAGGVTSRGHDRNLLLG